MPTRACERVRMARRAQCILDGLVRSMSQTNKKNHSLTLTADMRKKLNTIVKEDPQNQLYREAR